MALTKTSVSAFATQTVSATSATCTVSDAYAADFYVSIVVTGTATTAATVQTQHSPDASTFYTGPTYSAGLTAGTYSWVMAIPQDAQLSKLVYVQQAGGTSSVISAQVGKITGL